jgi:glycosyltransferase involved in cell wall biosynthesis
MVDVSVVMSVYNAAARIHETVSSVLDQAGCDLEFIVVDDGSTDGTASLLDAFAMADGRLRLIHQPNSGLTRALMRGCVAARAPFIARQDAADISLPGRLERQLAAFQRDADLAFISCATEYVEPGGSFLYRSKGSGLAGQPRHVIDMREQYGMVDGPSHHGSVMFRSELYHRVGGYRPQFYFGQDWDLWFRLAQLGKFQMIPETLYRATVGVGDISTSNKPLQDELAKLSLQALSLRLDGRSDQLALEQASLIRPEPRTGRARKRNSSGSYFLGECLRKNGNLTPARAYFLQAVRLDPLNVKAWARLAQIPFSRSRRESTG